MKPLTPARRRALEQLAHGPQTARAFASRFWPEKFEGRSLTGRSGLGILVGAGCSLKAGAFLRNLVRDGLAIGQAFRDGTLLYSLSADGLRALNSGSQPERQKRRRAPRSITGPWRGKRKPPEVKAKILAEAPKPIAEFKEGIMYRDPDALARRKALTERLIHE